MAKGYETEPAAYTGIRTHCAGANKWKPMVGTFTVVTMITCELCWMTAQCVTESEVNRPRWTFITIYCSSSVSRLST